MLILDPGDIADILERLPAIIGSVTLDIETRDFLVSQLRLTQKAVDNIEKNTLTTNEALAQIETTLENLTWRI
jgi:hypothetical protein